MDACGRTGKIVTGLAGVDRIQKKSLAGFKRFNFLPKNV
jgi:hypothetical protein